QHHAAHGGIEVTQRATTIDDLVAVLDHAVGIGADHGQFAVEPELGALAVHFGCIIIGIEIGDDHDLGLLGAGAAYVEPLIERVIVGGRTDIVDGPAGIFGDHGPRRIARGHNGVIGLAMHAQPV